VRVLAWITLAIVALAGAVGLAFGGSAVWSVIGPKPPANEPAPLWIPQPTPIAPAGVIVDRPTTQPTSDRSGIDDSDDVTTPTTKYTSGNSGFAPTTTVKSGAAPTSTAKATSSTVTPAPTDDPDLGRGSGSGH
jgi:hypothetical protein